MCKEYTLRVAEYNQPPVFTKGKGSRMWDVNGKEYLDLNSGHMCNILGHSHPAIVEAITQSCSEFIASTSWYPTEKSIELCARIAGLVSPPLKPSILISTGSEAIEVALSIAKKYTGGYEAASFHISLHGRSSVARTLTPVMGHQGYGPLIPGIFTMPGPYCYRCPIKLSFPGCNFACLDVGFEMLDRWAMGQVAAIFAEPVFGAGGIIDAPPGYFKLLKKKCEDRGTLLVFDECQTGLGRCGAMFAYEQEGIVPDILTMSKTLGGGLPVSSTTTSEEIKQTIMERGFMHSSTHAFDPLPSYAALAVIDTLEKDNLIQQSKEKGDYLKAGFQKLAEQHELIGDIRGRGLFQGIELVRDRETREPADRETRQIHARCMDKGLFFRVTGMAPRKCVLGFSPDYYITHEEIDKALNILDDTLSEVEAQT